MYRDLTRGSILRSLLLFALPMLAGDILQQLYNIADTLIVSRAIGRDALAAVGKRVYAYDLPHVDTAGAFDGRGRAFLHLPRERR